MPSRPSPTEGQKAAALSALLERLGRRVSGGMTQCISPDHDDSSPSMSVDLRRGLWNCHGCGRGGDAVDALVAVDGLDVAAAISAITGSEPPPPRARASRPRQLTGDERERIAAAGRIWEDASEMEALPVWMARKIDPSRVWDHGKISGDRVARSLRVREEDGAIVAAAADVETGERRGVQVVPEDREGRRSRGVLAGCAVSIGDDRLDRIVIVEGIADMLAAYLWCQGWCLAVASLGTTGMSRHGENGVIAIGPAGRLADSLNRRRARLITVIADGDPAGVEAAGAMVAMLRAARAEVEYLVCLPGRDPADTLHEMAAR